MSCKSREELVGKRFTSVRSDTKLKIAKISEWEWRSGFVRAVSTRDTNSADFTVLVEFDDIGWKSREYLKVHDIFQEFLVEHTLSWVERNEPNYKPNHGPWPALCFRAIVDKAGLFQHCKRPVEFLSDRLLTIVDEKEITYYKDGDENTVSTAKECPEVVKWLKTWTDYQDGQKILLTTPTVLLGYRVEVYRTEGTTQWYTAVIKSYNHTNKSLTLTDDTVLEEHNEDPTLIQMHLIGDGVVDSILNGVDVGVAQRRRPRSTVTKQNSKDSSSVGFTNNRATSSQSSNGANSSVKHSSAPTSSNISSPSSVVTGSSTTSSRAGGTKSKIQTSSSSSSSSPAASPSTAAGTAGAVSTLDSPVAKCADSPQPSASQQDNSETTASTPGKNQRQATKKKPDAPTKPARKPPTSRKSQKSASEENVDDETTVCKQTCNVLVKRIEEESKKQAKVREKAKVKPPRLRDKKLLNSGVSEEDQKPSDDPEKGDLINSECITELSSGTNISPNKNIESKCVSYKVEEDKDVKQPKSKTSPTSSPVQSASDQSLASGTASPILNTSAKLRKSSKQVISNADKEERSKGSLSAVSTCSSQNDTANLNTNVSKQSFQDKLEVKHDSTSKSNPATSDRDEESQLTNKTCDQISPSSSEKTNSDKSVGVRSESSKQNSEEDMYYKKQILRAEGSVSPHQRAQAPPFSEGIDVTRSLTDQLAKRSKSGCYSFNGDNKSGPEAVADVSIHHSTHPPHQPVERERTDTQTNLMKAHDFANDRHSAFTSVHSGPRSSILSSGVEDRADSRASDGQLPPHGSDDKRPGSRVDDIRSVRSSPGSSPFVIDRSETVHPYRDPELMRKNPVQSNVQNILAVQQKMSQSSQFPVVQNSVPGSASAPSPSAAAFAAGVSPLPARSLLSALPSTLPYTSAHQLPPSISHLSLPHGYPLDAVVRAQQQQHLAALQQQQQLINYSLGNPSRMTTLDAIWQRSKPPAATLATPWLLPKNQDGLLAGELAFRDAHLQIQMEHERIEMERREAERREIERERIEQERREKDRKELMERERMEKEKAEREKADRLRQLERERLERDRDRMEKDRIERERQEWEHKQNQERILRATVSVDTEAAVDKHFEESLRNLASQGISMFPSISRGTGRGFIPKTEPHHPYPPHTMPYHDDHYDHRKMEKLKKETEVMADEKRYVNKGGPPEKGSLYPNYPFGTSGFPSSSSMTHQSNQKATFSLYGYPTPPSTMTTEQLKQRGLIPESKHIKDEIVESKSHFSSQRHAVSPAQLSQPYHHKDMRDPHNSVIVKRETKPKMENPIAAHSHHTSPSSSSPRPPHPRPAHTPESRPERPLSSSTSPASGIPSHLLHHSSPVSSGNGHPQPHNAGLRPTEAHSSPRSQSPYKSAASHLQAMPLDYCKPLNASKQQRLASPVHMPGYSASVTQQETVSVSHSSTPFSYNLIQQGLVPNPIYSQGGSMHPSSRQPPQQHAPSSHSIANPQSSSGPLTFIPSQVSPPGNKRKSNSRDTSSVTSRKKPKGQIDHPGANQPMPIPVTTPQILTNPSPHTTSSNSSVPRPGIHSLASSSSSLPSSNLSSISSPYSFQSFVDDTVNTAYLQDQKKALEKVERERAASAGLTSLPNVTRSMPSVQGRRPDFSMSSQHMPSGSHSASTAAPLAAVKQNIHSNSSNSTSSNVNSDSYSSRIMDTINRVANNQVDTDSDTLSACSPPPQAKPSGTNSPLNRSLNSSSGFSHPHHMKKAWLQRHDEDKKSETPVPQNQGEEDSNSSLSQTRDIISCVENSSAALAEQGKESNTSPADVVVTLPNGNVSELNHHNESTSSASESEMQNSTKTSGPKKRVKSRKSGGGTAKRSRSDTGADTPSSTPPPASNTSGNNSISRKKTASNKRGKTDKESKIKQDESSDHNEEQMQSSSKQLRDNSPLPSKTQQEKNNFSNKGLLSSGAAVAVPSPRSEELSVPSPALSESNMANMSPASSLSSSCSSTNTTTMSMSGVSKDGKDKKKTRRSKEMATSIKDGKKSSSFNKPLVKMNVSTLKRTMAPFIQDGPCSEITPKLTKCRECKMTPVQRSKKQPNIFCRFYAFRRLKYNPRGIVTIDGFSELPDADPDDIEPWLPRFPVMEPELDVENSKFIISKVGDKFCELVEQEREAKTWAGEDVKIVWKRAVMGVREMCDVCDTTLFNMHWVCQKCGFVVCLDCYKVRIKEGKKPTTDDRWLSCSSNRQAHKASEMMLTQIIPSDALWELGRLIHDIRSKWSIPSNCPCGSNNAENSVTEKNGLNAQILTPVNNRKAPNGFSTEEHGSKQSKSKKQQDTNPLKNLDSYNPDTTSSPLSILAEVASMEPDSNREKMDSSKRKLDKSAGGGDDPKKGGCSTLRELLTKFAGKPKVSNDKKTKKGSGLSTLDGIIQSVVEKRGIDGGAPFKFLHYTPRLGGWKRELPIKIHTLTETSVLYPDVPHTWLCDGRLLRLHDAHHKGNLKIFQEQWKRGQPVLVSCANQKMDLSLWKPEVFSKEFGKIENEVVNCRTGDVIIGHCMSDFWDGFESLKCRVLDDKGAPMLLKLKDWPPGDDFSELLPSRFRDLMQALPLPEYTQRDGKLNLASRLPDFLVRPDLGPKMYNAYGSSQFPKEGTTNLHLDISDAVNVMVYVGVPGDGPGGRKAQEEAALRAIDDAGCDNITKNRVREVHEIPGALWHIYDAHDADKIRDFLNKVAKERGQKIENDHDAIHDQSWYLDKELCDRLYKEYGVEGYTIVQCHGDAIFIPAGAPHQVRNLHSCIKVAEDFVSPEHLNHCFRLTQEFRQLSETHSNHEDKLQVKNIIYHAVKDAIAVLTENDPEDE
ncbi:lysine-specific demethylase 3 [Plakobranchus ocellatus]|uniref:[histone H3]-dimethyl-L-lysine(9) demethylase n=1 Tax=Plakobranchus ocellatus TaxID=259542 RepID=A0AAV4DKZ3_9GAST|nr:lysine-specific demethylase 3 [Plakobranchus ocellatus]